jgi:hypothetical protein
MTSHVFSIDEAGDAGRSVATFTHMFVLSITSESEQVLSEVPRPLAAGLGRQRRVHQKSKLGCDNCKRRRIKVSPSPAVAWSPSAG